MRTRMIVTMMLTALSISLLSCSKNNTPNPVEPVVVPEEVIADFTNRFPNAQDVSWEQMSNVLKANFLLENTSHSAWFQNSGSWNWIRTDVKLKKETNRLPAAITEYINTNYPEWIIDDVDLIRTPSEIFYEIELKKLGEYDVTIIIKEDGTLINSFIDIDDDDDDDINASAVPQAVKETFNSLYPTAVRVEWEKERQIYEAEFVMDNTKYESLFKEDGTWLKTTMEINLRRSSLPDNIKNYISANYAGWRIDDAKFIKTPTAEYFEIELELGEMETTLFIDEKGNLVKP